MRASRAGAEILDLFDIGVQYYSRSFGSIVVYSFKDTAFVAFIPYSVIFDLQYHKEVQQYGKGDR